MSGRSWFFILVIISPSPLSDRLKTPVKECFVPSAFKQQQQTHKHPSSSAPSRYHLLTHSLHKHAVKSSLAFIRLLSTPCEVNDAEISERRRSDAVAFVCF